MQRFQNAAHVTLAAFRGQDPRHCQQFSLLAMRPSVPIAKEFPNAYVTSTDLSLKSVSLVLKHAQAEGVTNLTAQGADGQNLVDFADSTFRVVTCSYGLLYA